MRRGAQADRESGEGERHQRDPAGLAARDPMAEQAGGERNAQHEPAGHERLHERQGRARQRRDVQRPAAEAAGQAGQPGRGGEQSPDRGEGTPHGHRRGARRAAMLEQVAEVERDRGGQRKTQAEPHPGHPPNHRSAKASAAGVVSRHSRQE